MENETGELAEEESNEDISNEIKSKLDDDTAALCLIAPYIPAKLSPRARVMASIGIPEELGIEDAINEIKDKDINKLYLLLNSFGGGVTSSYKVARAIRNNFEEITVFIPHIAVSGGTVVAVTGNKIVMGEMSNLSPIDVQSVKGRQAYSVNAMIRVFGHLNNLFATVSEEDAPYPWKAMANKLNPVEFQECMDASDLMVQYAKRILEHEHSSLKDRADEIIEKLSRGFPIHEYAITIEEAKEILGDNIVFSYDEEEYLNIWKNMRDWLRLYVTEESFIHFIRYILPSEKESTKKTK